MLPFFLVQDKSVKLYEKHCFIAIVKQHVTDVNTSEGFLQNKHGRTFRINTSSARVSIDLTELSELPGCARKKRDYA